MLFRNFILILGTRIKKSEGFFFSNERLVAGLVTLWIAVDNKHTCTAGVNVVVVIIQIMTT